LVHGDDESTTHLKAFAHDTVGLSDDSVLAPVVGETVNVSAATHIYQVKLTDALVSSLNFAQVHLVSTG
jgi:cleavage and polyadenylation specificity factor subunit 2